MFASLASFTVAATSSRTNRSNCSTLIGCGWTPSFASLYDAIISKTIEGRITSWNAGATRIFGYDASEMIGESILRIIPPDLHDEEKEILAKLQRGERIANRARWSAHQRSAATSPTASERRNCSRS
jgi:PAS domain-containing protein